MIIDKKINGIIIFLIWKISRYDGANFCHVIRTVAFFDLIIFVILTNHSWKGDPAAFTIKAITAVTEINIFKWAFVFIMSREKIKIAEGIDWIMKYFILASGTLLEFVFIEQKARVLISRATQIEIHEFLRMQASAEVISDTFKKITVLIFFAKLQIWLFQNKFAWLFMFWRHIVFIT